jgi:hypothetical protein
MVCGGYCTERIEYLNPSESGQNTTVATVSLLRNAKCAGLLHKDRILTFHYPGSRGLFLLIIAKGRGKINLWLKAAIDSSSRANQFELGSDPDSVS